MTESYVPERGDLLWLSFEPAGRTRAGRPTPRPRITRSSYNRRSGLAVVCQVTRTAKGYPFEVAIPGGAPVNGMVLADHIGSVDWKARRAEPAEQVAPALMSRVHATITALTR